MMQGWALEWIAKALDGIERMKRFRMSSILSCLVA